MIYTSRNLFVTNVDANIKGYVGIFISFKARKLEEEKIINRNFNALYIYDLNDTGNETAGG